MSSPTRASKLAAAEAEMAATKSQLAAEIFEAGVDVAGIFDPTPTSDLISAGLALSKGDTVGAALSLVSTIPGVGDAVGKPFKAARSAAKIKKLTERVAALQQYIERLKKSGKLADEAEAALAKTQNKLDQKVSSVAPCPQPKAPDKPPAAPPPAKPPVPKSPGAYELNPKHGASSRGTAKGVSSPAPKDGQKALDNSVQVKSSSPRRVGVDPVNKEIVVFDEHLAGKYHGHVRQWDDLHPDMQNALVNAGLANRKGKIK